MQIDEGAKSYYDYPMEKEWEYKFKTATIRMLRVPTEKWQTLDPFIYISFDQLVNEEEIVKNLQVFITIIVLYNLFLC